MAMSKYLKESPKPVKKGGRGLKIGMLLYAVLFLLGTGCLLKWLWGCMDAYEKTRPAVVREAYLDQLTKTHICDLAAQTYGQVDHNIQSEEACRDYILDALTGEISCAKKSSESTETKQVYALRCGGKNIGTFTMTAGPADGYGFTPWQISGETVDLSYLLGTQSQVRVPEGYGVYANGALLDESYVAQTDEVPYDVFAEFYENYQLPMLKMLTYQVAPIFGEVTLEVKDSQGNIVDPEQELTVSFPDNCTQEQEQALQVFVEEFLRRYVVFSGCANDARVVNYYNLMPMVVEGSRLQTRMHDAIDGLRFAQSYGDKIASITVHQYIDMGQDHYLCDVTYLVDTMGRKGVVQTTNNVKIIVAASEDGLKAEAMTSY